jgi:sarcosine/dimethylglycine N-methyltransferase
MSTQRQYSSDVVQIAQQYYNSSDADRFYATIWGGEDIHIGLYTTPDEPIFDASQRTVARMASMLNNINRDSQVIDLGAGYGGSARYLAHQYGCAVTCVNLSEVQNERNRQLNREQGIDHLIEVIDGSFEEVPKDDATYDAIWSQDAFLHSGNRRQVLEEARRLLKPGGEMIFTDPMQSDDCPEGVLQPILDRIHLSTLGSFGFYQDTARELGFEVIEIIDLTSQLSTHYGRVRQELEQRTDEMEQVVSRDYINRMLTGLSHWVEGGQRGYLNWGILHFRLKP